MWSRQLIEKGRRDVQKSCSDVTGKRRVRSEQSHRQEKLEGSGAPWVPSRPPLRTVYELFNSWEFRWEMTSHACNLRIQDKGTAPRGCRASIYSTHMPGSKPSWLVPTCLSPVEYFICTLPSVEEPGPRLHGSAHGPSAAQAREVALSRWCQALICPALRQSMWSPKSGG